MFRCFLDTVYFTGCAMIICSHYDSSLHLSGRCGFITEIPKVSWRYRLSSPVNSKMITQWSRMNSFEKTAIHHRGHQPKMEIQRTKQWQEMQNTLIALQLKSLIKNRNELFITRDLRCHRRRRTATPSLPANYMAEARTTSVKLTIVFKTTYKE